MAIDSDLGGTLGDTKRSVRLIEVPPHFLIIKFNRIIFESVSAGFELEI